MLISVVADDSAFPEIYEVLRRQREACVKLIAWRNLREIFGVLRRREILGLLVDWGYRSDGIPCASSGHGRRCLRDPRHRRKDRIADRPDLGPPAAG